MVQRDQNSLWREIQRPFISTYTDFGRGPWGTRIYLVAGAIATPAPLAIWHGIDSASLALIEIGLEFAGAASLTGLAGKYLSQRYRRKEQQKRDQRALEILRACQTLAPDFSLYLRSFETTGRTPLDVESELVGFDSLQLDPVADFENSLATAVERGAPLIALGRPGEQIGAGRILTADDDWQEVLALLARHATLVFMAPSTRAGTAWEIDWLVKARCLRKTVWIQPPHVRHFLRRSSYDWAAAWGPITKKMQSVGLHPPPYDKGGLLFTLNEDGELLVGTKLKGRSGPRLLGWYLDRHLEKVTALRRAG